MNIEQLKTLKQLIDARASGTEKYLEQCIGGVERSVESLEQRMATKEDTQELRADMDSQFNTVLDAIGERFEVARPRFP